MPTLQKHANIVLIIWLCSQESIVWAAVIDQNEQSIVIVAFSLAYVCSISSASESSNNNWMKLASIVTLSI